jgi:hypothetical protein
MYKKLLVLLLLISSTANGQTFPVNPDIWSAMENVSGNEITEVGNLTAVARNNIASIPVGKQGLARDFALANALSNGEGVQDLVIGDHALIPEGNETFSGYIWVRLRSKQVGNMMFIGKADAGSSAWWLDYDTASDRYRFVIQGASGFTVVTANNFGSPTLNDWDLLIW